ncbi:hypothetical protein EI293_04305 [Hymenobacter perfusus]|uniref:Transposase DDE domain-containing protein n=1 Tax=Hymenobacter perfusus TaxID=1236770 RepID=A0A428KIX7_9BACT|nr:hypothetical protein [Hymenobacter perfusus]RSK46396.1 hypothetical protein EI293_04305 [Hymenobacter perfusus]
MRQRPTAWPWAYTSARNQPATSLHFGPQPACAEVQAVVGKRPLHPAQDFLLQHFRKGIKTCFSQLTARLPKQIHAVTIAGFALKIALFILAHTL